jgi:hypothetical protein
MTDRPQARSLAAALTAVNAFEPGAVNGLAAAVNIDEAVLVPLGPDRETPLAVGDSPEHRALVAFTSLDRVRWAMPDAPPVGVVPVRQVLGWSVRFQTPVRLDHTSPAEVYVTPASAAALLEGRAPVDSSGLAAGAQYAPPASPVVVPDLAPPPDGPALHEPPTYGTAWRPGTFELEGPLAPGTAGARHDAGKDYVALIPRTGFPPVVAEVGPERVTVRYVDSAARDDLVSSFARHGELLFRDQMILKQYDEGAPVESPRSMQLLRFAPDGTQRTWIQDGDEETTIDSSGVDVSRHWERFPAFGHYDRVLDLDR